jgi:hypothetical protein
MAGKDIYKTFYIFALEMGLILIKLMSVQVGASKILGQRNLDYGVLK